MGLLWRGVASLGGLALATAWLGPRGQAGTRPAPNAAGSLQANGDGDRLRSRRCRADILARTQSPSAPAPLPAGTTRTRRPTPFFPPGEEVRERRLGPE